MLNARFCINEEEIVIKREESKANLEPLVGNSVREDTALDITQNHGELSSRKLIINFTKSYGESRNLFQDDRSNGMTSRFEVTLRATRTKGKARQCREMLLDAGDAAAAKVFV